MFNRKVHCRHCGSSEGIIKHGSGKTGYQRYRCMTCMRTFQAKYIYNISSFREKKSASLAAMS
ncbi:IS1/IS1595 family N-terminal zinc-binding domain-containing protein [Leminorella grimontii]|uniref:IS1/IS1595 family N-terminal zinc-binding domain-containing protein n=1 Tax=Leminorella grimontii TaxID=82981 RepID=UPI0010B36971|nr:Transposase and inactivated derivatives [Leminorella grimontii]